MEVVISYTLAGLAFQHDKRDLRLVRHHRWSANKEGYIKCTTCQQILHRLILGLPSNNLYVDHINRNPLDNRRSNLRVATPSQNQMNKQVQSNNKLHLKGIYIERRPAHSDSFVAQVRVNGKRYRRRAGTLEKALENYTSYLPSITAHLE